MDAALADGLEHLVVTRGFREECMRHGFRIAVGMALAALVLAGAGCTAQQGRRGWGDDALWPVDGERIVKAAADALLDPQTWVPAAGALVFTIDQWDYKVSHWASEHTPIFGSQEDALQASDDLWSFLETEMPVTALATPSGDNPQEWVIAKAKGLVVEYGAIGTNGYATEWLKDGAGRKRPNGKDHQSFPSGHSSSSFAHATLSNRNLDSIDMPGGLRQALQIGNLGLAGTVAWARVEGKAHYPSDVLAGAALGHFLTAFIYDAFMNLPKDSRLDVAISPTDGGATMQVAIRF
jgi:hypothetical protein